MAPTHPVLIALWVAGLGLAILAIVGKASVPIFGEIGTDKRHLRWSFGFLGSAVVILTAHITFSPAAAAWILMEQSNAGKNIGGGGESVSVASGSLDACMKACSGEPTCDAWTFQPDHRSDHGFDCFLWGTEGVSLQIENKEKTWFGRKRVFARSLDGVWPCL